MKRIASPVSFDAALRAPFWPLAESRRTLRSVLFQSQPKELIMNPLRRRLTALLPLALIAQAAHAATDRPLVEVWKDPSCGCCKDWVAHLKAGGFNVKMHDTGNAAARERLGMPNRYGSCHTAKVDGYVIEGHVPAREIDRLLRERPDAVGLAVPGMPVGSPGMDGPAYGNRMDPYDVLLVRRDGSAGVFRSYR